MTQNLNHLHWQEGGTMLTNFDAKDYSIFRKAIRKYHKKYNTKKLFISKKAFYGGTQQIELASHYSLHILKIDDLSAFWRIYDTILERTQAI